MSTWNNYEKSGTATGGWDYNEEDILYNSALSVDNQIVRYNGLGTAQTFTNETKH